MSKKEIENKHKEEERLEELKQAMKSETKSMVENEKSQAMQLKRYIHELLSIIDSEKENIDDEFDGLASEAALENMNKVK